MDVSIFKELVAQRIADQGLEAFCQEIIAYNESPASLEDFFGHEISQEIEARIIENELLSEQIHPGNFKLSYSEAFTPEEPYSSVEFEKLCSSFAANDCEYFDMPAAA